MQRENGKFMLSVGLKTFSVNDVCSRQYELKEYEKLIYCKFNKNLIKI